MIQSKDRAEDLLRYSRNLIALGRVVSWMGYSQDGEELLGLLDEQLGDIVSDYATGIEEMAMKLYPIVNDWFEFGEISLVSRARKARASIEERPLALLEKLGKARRCHDEIAKFIDNDLQELAHLKKFFERTIEDIEEELCAGKSEDRVVSIADVG